MTAFMNISLVSQVLSSIMNKLEIFKEKNYRIVGHVLSSSFVSVLFFTLLISHVALCCFLRFLLRIIMLTRMTTKTAVECEVLV